MGQKSPSGIQGRSPGRGLGTKSPEGDAVCKHCLPFLTAETIKISHNSPPGFLTSRPMFHGGTKRHFGVSSLAGGATAEV